MVERPAPIPFETLGGTGSKNSRGSPRMALVDNRYKLLTDMDDADDKVLLFDLVNDPGETKNIAAAHPAIVETMKVKLSEFRQSCKHSLMGKDYSQPFTPNKDDIHPSEVGLARKVKK